MFHVLQTKFVHYTNRAWAGGSSLRKQKKNPQAHVQQVYLEELIRLPSPPKINVSVCLSVRMEACRFLLEIIIRVSTWIHLSVFRPLKIPIHMCKKKMQVIKKIHRKLFTAFVYYQPNSCTKLAERGLEGAFSKTEEKKFLQPMRGKLVM
jgi:hypothetical protein